MKNNDINQADINSDCPLWFDGRSIDEIMFCNELLKEHPMKCFNGTFFTQDGQIDNIDIVRNEIFNKLAPYVKSSVSKKVDAMLLTLKMVCHVNDIPIRQNRIHLNNGTLFTSGKFTPEKEFCRNRLPIDYNPNAQKPELWLKFISELLSEEDIPTLQEYMGYCLIPTTKAQKMLFIIGKGGEGKSRLGPVLRYILGENMSTGSISKVEVNQFARADLEHKLLMLDDDIKLEALPQTNIIKSIVTAELPMDLEKKGKQSYQGKLYVRFMGLGNGTLQSLYDKSYGFFRRQIILYTKERPLGRVDDPFLAEKLCKEAEGIFLWAFEGLQRLMLNRFKFTMSEQSKANITEAIKDSNNIVEFMESDGYFSFSGEGEISSKEFYEIYRNWCFDNVMTPLSAKTFSSYLLNHQTDYSLEYTNKIHMGKRYVRGFLGVTPSLDYVNNLFEVN